MGNPSPLESGGRFGKYLILRELGRGGKGVVYEALDSVLDRKVALKLILPDEGQDAKAAEEEGQRFLREARLCANLPKHPHIVSVYEAGEIEGKKYLAMELVQGQSMMGWRKKTGLKLADRLRLLRDVALAMDHAHRHGLVHRDLKPQNILVDSENQPHVTDFGLAKKLGQEGDSAKVAPGFVLGTPAYMSPEHARGLDTVDHRSDVFSLGVMLYEALSGRTPFRGENNAEIMDRVVHAAVTPPTVRTGSDPGAVALHKALEAVCVKALVKNPKERLESARALADAVSAALGEGIRVAAPAPAAAKKPPVWLWAGGAAALVAIVVVLVLALGGSSGPSPEEAMIEAAKLLEQGKTADAVALYDRILSADPAHAGAGEGKRIAQKKLADRIEADKRKAVDDVRDKTKREMEEQARLRDEEHKKQLEKIRLTEEEQGLKLKMELARAEAAKQAAEEKFKAEKEAFEKAQAEAAKPATPAPAPAATTPATPPPPAVPVNPFAPPTGAPLPFPAAAAPTGEPKALEDGVLHFEAEDFTGGAAPVEGEDYHDSTPQNSGNRTGRNYRNFGVDIGQLQQGTGLYVGDISPGEWLRFKFQGGGRYEIEIRYWTPRAVTMHLEIDGENVSGPLNLSAPAVQQTWTTGKADLKAIVEGAHQVKLVFDQPGGGLSIDYFRLRKLVRSATPDAALVKEAEKQVRDLFKADYAKKSPTELQILVRKLRDESQRPEHEPVVHYVLLTEARDVASQVGDLGTAMDCIRDLERMYVVDGAAMRVAALGAVSKTAKTPEAWKAVSEGYLAAADLASDAEEYDAAVAAATKGEAAARTAKDATLLADAQAHVKELTALKDEHRAVKGALKTLEEKPDDAAANLAAGVYYCFAREEWPRGLPMLAKGSDGAIAAAAKAEIEKGADPAAEGAIADAWGDAGTKKSTGALKTRLLSRALFWYEKALPDAVGLARTKIESQIEVISKLIYGTDSLRKGLVFWVEPGRDAGEGMREFVAGSKVVNNNAVPTVDSGGRAFSFGRGWLDYAASDLVKAVERQGSVFAWIKTPNTQQRGGVVNRGDPNLGIDDFGLWLAGGNVGAWFNWPNNRQMQLSKGAVTPGKWCLIGYTWDDRNIVFYIDGKEDGVAPVSSMGGVPQRKCARVSVGSNPPGGHDPYNGVLGSAMIYGRALTPVEIKQLYMGTRIRFR